MPIHILLLFCQKDQRNQALRSVSQKKCLDFGGGFNGLGASSVLLIKSKHSEMASSCEMGKVIFDLF